MNPPDPDWATITSYQNLPGCPQPMVAMRAWLRERGIDWMPLSDNEIRDTTWLAAQVLMVDGMAGPASRSAPMRFADSVCIQTNPPRSFAGRRLRPGGTLPQKAKYDDAVYVAPIRAPRRGPHPRGSSQQALDLSAVAGRC
jgi:hypothetical protein